MTAVGPASRAASNGAETVRLVLDAPEAIALADHLDAGLKEAAGGIRAAIAQHGALNLTMAQGEALELAMGLHRTGRTGVAEQFYRAILATTPDDAKACHYLGVLLSQTKRSDEGLRLVERSMKALAQEPWAWNNYGNLHKTAGNLDQAARAYRKALGLDPEFADAHNNLGMIYRAERQWDAAERHYARAIALNPNFAAAHLNRGNLMVALGNFDAAIENLARGAELDPRGSTGALRLLARAFVLQGDLERAASIYREWAAQEPDNPVPLHHLQACTGENPPARASDEYVTASFDAYAKTFDEHLGRLEYRAPELVAAALDALNGPGGVLGDVADLGCGTGLCGPLLRSGAATLIGVDLSGGMLAKARERGVYDEIIRSELTSFLDDHPNTFDTLVSADTLCYFGALDGFAAAAHRALRSRGTLVFTVEHDERDGFYHLLPSGRYAHARSYVEASLEQAGFIVARVAAATLREEMREPVPGLVVTALRSARSIGE